MKIQIPFKTCNGGDVEDVSRSRRLSGSDVCERRGKMAKLEFNKALTSVSNNFETCYGGGVGFRSFEEQRLGESDLSEGRGKAKLKPGKLD